MYCLKQYYAPFWPFPCPGISLHPQSASSINYLIERGLFPPTTASCEPVAKVSLSARLSESIAPRTLFNSYFFCLKPFTFWNFFFSLSLFACVWNEAGRAYLVLVQQPLWVCYPLYPQTQNRKLWQLLWPAEEERDRQTCPGNQVPWNTRAWWYNGHTCSPDWDELGSPASGPAFEWGWNSIPRYTLQREGLLEERHLVLKKSARCWSWQCSVQDVGEAEPSVYASVCFSTRNMKLKTTFDFCYTSWLHVFHHPLCCTFPFPAHMVQEPNVSLLWLPARENLKTVEPT